MQIDYVPISVLRPAERQLRATAEASLREMREHIKRNGILVPLVVRRADETVLHGNVRLAAAKSLGVQEVPVVYVDLSKDSASRLALAMNKISGEWDKEKLKEVVQALLSDDVGEHLLRNYSGFSDDEVSKLLQSRTYKPSKYATVTVGTLKFRVGKAAMSEWLATVKSKSGKTDPVGAISWLIEDISGVPSPQPDSQA